MSKSVIFAIISLTAVATASTKDKSPKVPFHEMALGMQDAFNCGLVVEEHLHGRLKDNADLYGKERQTYNCDHVEAVLNTLDDQNNAAPKTVIAYLGSARTAPVEIPPSISSVWPVI